MRTSLHEHYKYYEHLEHREHHQRKEYYESSKIWNIYFVKTSNNFSDAQKRLSVQNKWVSRIFKIFKKLESFVYKNRTYLCLGDANQPKAGSELKITFKARNCRFLMERYTWHSAESSQCITKLITDDKQYS